MPATHPFAQRWNNDTRHYPLIADLVADCPVVLDVGCGDGTLSRYLASLGHQVIGINRDPSALPADSEGAHFIVAEASGLPFPDDSFDAVVSVMVLHRTRLELALVEMRRVLKPGGLFADVGSARDKGVGEVLRSAAGLPGDLLVRRGTTAWRAETHAQGARLGWEETRQAITRMLPQAQFRRIGGRRYLATWRRPS